MIQQEFCPLDFIGLLVVLFLFSFFFCVCVIKTLLHMASWAKLSQALHRPFSRKCFEVNEQMADKHSQSINWLHRHLIKVHVTTLQQKFSILENLMYKFIITVDFFHAFPFFYWDLWEVYQLATLGLNSRGVKYSFISNGCGSVQFLWEFRLMVYTVSRIQRTTSYHSCDIWNFLLYIYILLICARYVWIRCTELRLQLG